MTTPSTLAGKMTVIVYGLIGCSGCILFFNLFLERIITVLALMLRSVYECRRRTKERAQEDGEAAGGKSRRGSRYSGDEDDDLADWKPSVYWVMVILFAAATIIACCAAALFHVQENWSYLDSLYYCFVSFATIGFGDLVAGQHNYYPYVYLELIPVCPTPAEKCDNGDSSSDLQAICGTEL